MTYKQTYIVISKSDKTTLGPFETREAAIKWAEGIKWVDGYVVRSLWPVVDAPASRPVVKGLEWERGWMNAEAQSAVGTYSITYRRDGSFNWVIGDHNAWASSWDEAKAAAQSDFEQRILSALN